MRINEKTVTIYDVFVVDGYTIMRMHKVMSDMANVILSGECLPADKAHLMYEEIDPLFSRVTSHTES